MESTTSREKQSSIIQPAAYMSKLIRLSTVKALPTRMLFSTPSASRSNLLATALMRSGRNVFSVSM